MLQKAEAYGSASLELLNLLIPFGLLKSYYITKYNVFNKDSKKKKKTTNKSHKLLDCRGSFSYGVLSYKAIIKRHPNLHLNCLPLLDRWLWKGDLSFKWVTIFINMLIGYQAKLSYIWVITFWPRMWKMIH